MTTPTTSTSMELTALRHAVEHLAHKLGATPTYSPPNRTWTEPISGLKYGEWDVQTHDGRRLLAVRATVDDGISGTYLVDYRGDMHALETSDTHRLIEALCGSLTYLQRHTGQQHQVRRLHDVCTEMPADEPSTAPSTNSATPPPNATP